MHTICLIGLPGAGKSTLASTLVSDGEMTLVSFGRLLRSKPQGWRAGFGYPPSSNLGDHLCTHLVHEAIRHAETRMVLLDGFPRSAPHAALLDAVGFGPAGVLLLDAPQDACEVRILRRADGNRTDGQNMAQIRRRLARHAEALAELTDYYSERVTVIDATQSASTVLRVARHSLGARCAQETPQAWGQERLSDRTLGR